MSIHLFSLQLLDSLTRTSSPFSSSWLLVLLAALSISMLLSLFYYPQLCLCNDIICFCLLVLASSLASSFCHTSDDLSPPHSPSWASLCCFFLYNLIIPKSIVALELNVLYYRFLLHQYQCSLAVEKCEFTYYIV